ncbi:MAG: flavin monoamine oxidase family protein [Planctomycetia bacterium]|nr:flavin monoamine oxidase family protein [Planctomycetia bacterium]
MGLPPNQTDNGHGAPVDVLVIGAGLAGLCAGRYLVRRNVSCTVIEARERVGGRTQSQRLGNDTVDLGGQWIGPMQSRLKALTDELNVATFPQYHDGRKLLSWGGKIQSYTGDLPSLSPLAQLELLWNDYRLKSHWRTLPPERPWSAPRAAEWDGMTVETWKQRHMRSKGARLFIDVVVRAVLTSEPRDVSFLYFLNYLRSGRGLESLISIAGGAQQERFVGGAQQISERLTEGLGHRVVLESPVRSIEQDVDGVTVRTDKGPFQGRYVIVAIPPVLAGRIHYAASLPAKRDQLTARIPMGSVIKYVAVYERPFWRTAGFSGEVVSDTGPTVTTFDDSSHDGTQPALVTFSDAVAARQWSGRTPQERQQAVLAEFARFFGPEALQPTHFAEKDWNLDPWSRGCYVGVMGPGVMTTFGEALRERCGRIHWSGTETADEWMGYLDGAVQSGDRAAAEVCARLQRAGEPAVALGKRL